MNNIVFMGTPDFAAASLQALYDAGLSVSAVFTQPDKPKNRGMKMIACPVKELALRHETPVYQPANMRDGEALSILKELDPDLIVAVAYGKILPIEILNLPHLGCVNIHGSLLPAYRGSAPIQWTILNGDKQAGVTAMYMAERLDAGNIIDSITTDVLPNETSGELFNRLAPLGGELLVRVIQNIFCGQANSYPQDENKATYAPPLSKAMSPIDWTKPAEQILCQIHGLNPWPGATAALNGADLKIHRACLIDLPSKAAPGSIVQADKNGIVVAAGEGAVCITEVQASGGKRMSSGDYLRGHPICL